MPNTISPNMSLILPTVGQEPGPNWALDLNSSLSLVDQHNHAPGSGVQISPAGMNINTDLPFNGNNAISLKSIRFSSQVSPLAGGSDIGCLYVSGANLYYNDTLGNQIQMTAGGAVNGTPGSIGNLVAPAAVNYVPANQTFVFQSNQTNNTPGTLDIGNVLIRNMVAGGNYIQIQPNAVLPANYSLTLPSGLPASTSVLLLDNVGNIATSGTATALSVTTLNSTNVNASNNVSIKNDTGLLQFKNTLDTVQFASLTGTSSGLSFNLPDTADSYTFNVNSVSKISSNDNRTEIRGRVNGSSVTAGWIGESLSALGALNTQQTGAPGAPLLFTSGPSLTLTAGLWLVVGSTRVAEASGGSEAFQVFFRTSGGTTFGFGGPVFASGGPAIPCVGIVNLTASEIVRFYFVQNGAGTIGAGLALPNMNCGFIQAVRIG